MKQTFREMISSNERMSEASQLPRKIRVGDMIELPVSGNIKMASALITNIYVSTGLGNKHQTFVEYDLSWTEDVDGDRSKRKANKAKESQSLDAFIKEYF